VSAPGEEGAAGAEACAVWVADKGGLFGGIGSAELIASSHSVEEIGKYLTADSIGYLSLDGMLRAVTETRGFDRTKSEFCHACFSGEYPIEVAAPPKTRQLPLLLV